MKKLFRMICMGVILCFCIGCDQISKNAAQTYLQPSQPVTYLGGLLQLRYAENPGAMLGLGAEVSPNIRLVVLIGLNLILLGGVLSVFLKEKEIPWVSVVATGLLLGGGVSNLLDRLYNGGQVIDFLYLGLGKVGTGIFNLADVAIFAGVGLLIGWGIGGRKQMMVAEESGLQSE